MLHYPILQMGTLCGKVKPRKGDTNVHVSENGLMQMQEPQTDGTQRNMLFWRGNCDCERPDV